MASIWGTIQPNYFISKTLSFHNETQMQQSGVFWQHDHSTKQLGFQLIKSGLFIPVRLRNLYE